MFRSTIFPNDALTLLNLDRGESLASIDLGDINFIQPSNNGSNPFIASQNNLINPSYQTTTTTTNPPPLYHASTNTPVVVPTAQSTVYQASVQMATGHSFSNSSRSTQHGPNPSNTSTNTLSNYQVPNMPSNTQPQQTIINKNPPQKRKINALGTLKDNRVAKKLMREKPQNNSNPPSKKSKRVTLAEWRKAFTTALQIKKGWFSVLSGKTNRKQIMRFLCDKKLAYPDLFNEFTKKGIQFKSKFHNKQWGLALHSTKADAKDQFQLLLDKKIQEKSNSNSCPPADASTFNAYQNSNWQSNTSAQQHISAPFISSDPHPGNESGANIPKKNKSEKTPTLKTEILSLRELANCFKSLLDSREGWFGILPDANITTTSQINDFLVQQKLKYPDFFSRLEKNHLKLESCSYGSLPGIALVSDQKDAEALNMLDTFKELINPPDTASNHSEEPLIQSSTASISKTVGKYRNNSPNPGRKDGLFAQQPAPQNHPGEPLRTQYNQYA